MLARMSYKRQLSPMSLEVVREETLRIAGGDVPLFTGKQKKATEAVLKMLICARNWYQMDEAIMYNNTNNEL